MASRTDQLQSYQFRTRRVLAALVMRETDPRQSPLRRGIGAVFAGLMITVLAGAGFGIYGLVVKVGGGAWKTQGAVVVERETGATYVYLDGTLFPTLNLTSAMLAGGQDNPVIHKVWRSALADLPRGYLIGIPGAPDSLPGAGERVGLPWTSCTQPEPDPSNNGQLTPRVSLAVGVGATGGKALDDAGLLVHDGDAGQTFLVWAGATHALKDPALVLDLFGAAKPIDVGTAWVQSLPPGTPIEAPKVTNPGELSHKIPQYHNGDVLRYHSADGDVYTLIVDDGKVTLTDLMYRVYHDQHPDDPMTIQDASVVSAMHESPTVQVPGDLPSQPPELAAAARTDLICATTTAAGQTGRAEPAPQVTVGATVDGLERAVPTQQPLGTSRALADWTLVPSGRVAIVHDVQTVDPPTATGSYLIITDTGMAYGVLDDTVLPLLGFSRSQAVDIPDYLVRRIPQGPTLDPHFATMPAAVNPA